MCKVRVRQKQWSIAAGNGRFEPHPLIPWGVPASGDPHAPPMIPSPPRGEEEEFEDPYYNGLDRLGLDHGSIERAPRG